MDPRSAQRAPYASRVPRPPARPAPRPQPMDERMDSMKIGGFVMLGLAAAELLEKFVLSFWLDLDKSTAGAAGTAFFEALLGIAMLQGSNAARKVVLWLTGLSILGMGLLVATAFAIGFGHLWPIFAASGAVVLGVFLLNVTREPTRAVVMGALALVLVGWVGSVAASVLLAGTVDLGTMKVIREWSSPDRSFEDARAGLALKAPAQWVVLKEGNPVAGDTKPLVTLANTEVLELAQVHREERAYSVTSNVEFFLDSLAKAKETEKTEFRALGRTDTRIGPVPARRMKASWKERKDEVVGSFTAWQDGPVFYYVSVVAPRVLNKRLDADVEALERSVTFGAPWAAFLRDRATPTRQQCPLLSEACIVGLTRSVPRDAAPEAYCREGYRLAFAGQPLLETTSSARLGALMKSFFAGLPRAKADRFGAYTERLRTGGATTPADDREMMQAARAAMDSLAPDVQEDLRGHFALAVEMGQVAGGAVQR